MTYSAPKFNIFLVALFITLTTLTKAFEYWLRDMYMDNPIALPVNSNPGWVFPKKNFANEEERCLYLARVAKGMFDYKVKFEK